MPPDRADQREGPGDVCEHGGSPYTCPDCPHPVTVVESGAEQRPVGREAITAGARSLPIEWRARDIAARRAIVERVLAAVEVVPLSALREVEAERERLREALKEVERVGTREQIVLMPGVRGEDGVMRWPEGKQYAQPLLNQEASIARAALEGDDA